VARQFAARGFSKIYALKGGWRAWKKADFPTLDKSSVEESCIACHALLDSGVVADWRSSRHAEGGVICSVCHGDNHTSKEDARKVIMPRVESCMKCHETWAYPHIGEWFKEFRKTHNPPYTR
jgi:uncharacterized CHY-type Zn-finger protein